LELLRLCTPFFREKRQHRGSGNGYRLDGAAATAAKHGAKVSDEAQVLGKNSAKGKHPGWPASR